MKSKRIESYSKVKPIAWHEECLRNVKSRLASKKLELERVQREIKRYEEIIELSENQIASAKILGKEGYDADKFKVVRHGK